VLGSCHFKGDENFTELYSSVSYFSLRELGDLFGRTKPNNVALWRRDWLKVLLLGFRF